MKMALLGGGSVRTLYFARSFAQYASRLGIDQLDIMDNDPTKLRCYGLMAKLEAERIARELGVAINIRLTGSAEEAVDGADYVVTTLRVGGDEARVLDERVALSHGLIGQETTGAGGFAYACRTVPVLLDYLALIERRAHHATVFNFTNPSGLVTQALHDAGYGNVIGICDNASGIKHNVCSALKLNASDVRIRTYGLNHLTWSDKVEVGGTDILPQLFQRDDFVENFYEFSYFDRDLVRQLRAIPNGYLYYYYHREQALAHMQASPQTRGESILAVNQQMLAALAKVDIEKDLPQALALFQHYMHLREGSYMKMELGGEKPQLSPIDVRALGIGALNPDREQVELYEGYAGVAFNYIQAVRENRGVEIALNVRNNGAVGGLAADDVVEVSCIVDAQGPRRDQITAAEIPAANAALMRTVKAYEKLTVQAIREQSLALAREALTLHPLVNSYSLAKALVADYAAAHQAAFAGWR